MANQPTLVIGGNTADAERAIAGLERKYDALENKMKHLKSMPKPGSIGNPFEAAQSGLTSLMGQMMTFGGAAALLKAEFNNIRERGKEAFEAQKGTAGALEQLAINVPEDVPLAKAKERSIEISKRTGVDVDQVMKNLASAFSAQGNLASESSFKAVEKVAALLPNLTEMQEPLAGSILDIRKLHPEVTEEQSLGMLRKAQRMSRLTDFGKFAKNLAPGILAASMYDNDVQGGMALGSAMSQIGIDATGEQTRTAMIQLVGQSREFFGKDAEGKTNAELLTMLGDEKTRETFMKGGEQPGFKKGDKKWAGASFEKRFEKPVEEMLTPDTEANKILKDYQRTIGTFKENEAQYVDLQKQLSADQSKKVVDFAKRLEADTKAVQEGDTKSSTWAAVQDNVEKSMKARGFSFTEQWGAASEMNFSQMIGRDPVEAATNMLEGRAAGYQRGAEWAERTAKTHPLQRPREAAAQRAEGYREKEESLREIVAGLKANAAGPAEPNKNDGELKRIAERQAAAAEKQVELLNEQNALLRTRPINRNAQGE